MRPSPVSIDPPVVYDVTGSELAHPAVRVGWSSSISRPDCISGSGRRSSRRQGLHPCMMDVLPFLVTALTFLVSNVRPVVGAAPNQSFSQPS